MVLIRTKYRNDDSIYELKFAIKISIKQYKNGETHADNLNF
jgi:hypothetical protein